MIAAALPWLLGNWKAIALALLIAAVPAAYKAGKWRQGFIDRAAFEEQQKVITRLAYAEAEQKSRQIIEEQQAKADEARAELEDAKKATTLAEEEAQANDAKADELERKLADEQAKANPTCPRPVVRSCSGFSDNDLDELRRKYPSGPIRRAKRGKTTN